MSTFLEGISLWMSNLNTISGLPTGFSKIEPEVSSDEEFKCHPPLS
jgi:hypothetical protein